MDRANGTKPINDDNRIESTNDEPLVRNNSIKESQPNSYFSSSVTNDNEIKTTVVQDRNVVLNADSISINLDNVDKLNLNGFNKMTDDIVNQVEEKHGETLGSKLKLMFKEIGAFLNHIKGELALEGALFAGLLFSAAIAAVAAVFMGGPVVGIIVFLTPAICIVPFMICLGVKIVNEMDNYPSPTDKEKNDESKKTDDESEKDLIDAMESIKDNVLKGVTPDNLTIKVVDEKSDEHKMDSGSVKIVVSGSSNS